MYINFETIIQVGKVLGALALIGGILISLSGTWLTGDKLTS